MGQNRNNQNIEPKKKKKIWKRVLWSVAGILIIVIVFAARLFHNSMPTNGEAIRKYDNPKAALLVIDVQAGTTGTDAYQPSEELVSKINQAQADAAALGMEIIYIRQENKKNPIDWILSMGNLMEGKESVSFDSRLNLLTDVEYTKNISDSFSNPEFEAYLQQKQIDTLYLTGVDAYACVMKTAMGGLNRNYKVVAIEDCIGTRISMGTQTAFDSYQAMGVQNMEHFEIEENDEN